MSERVELYSEETGRASKPLDVHGVLLCVGDNVKSTPDFHETDCWVGVVVAVGQQKKGEVTTANGVEVRARLYVQGISTLGRGAILYSAAYLWERVSAAADVSDDESFT